jgi:hypothetical protein
MQKSHPPPTLPFVNVAANTITADVSCIRDLDHRCAIDVIARRRQHQKDLRADSESQILAIKKFSWKQPRRLIEARQDRIFERIATGDSQAVSRCAMPDFHRSGRSARAPTH